MYSSCKIQIYILFGACGVPPTLVSMYIKLAVSYSLGLALYIEYEMGQYIYLLVRIGASAHMQTNRIKLIYLVFHRLACLLVGRHDHFGLSLICLFCCGLLFFIFYQRGKQDVCYMS